MDKICDELDDFYYNFIKADKCTDTTVKTAPLQSNPQKCFFNTQTRFFGISNDKRKTNITRQNWATNVFERKVTQYEERRFFSTWNQ